MSTPQITVRLDPQEKVAFDSYAEKCGLDSSELAKLLFVRERRLERLLSLKNKKQFPQSQRQTWGRGIKKLTVTAHFSTRGQVDAFDRYARDCNLTRQSAAAWLLRTELNEQWLEKALSLKVRARRN
jgi:hypothetical protein